MTIDHHLIHCLEFMKKILFLLLVVFYGEIFAMTNESLKAVAQKYTDVLAEFGKEKPTDLIALMKTVFAPDCVKKLNGAVVCKSMLDLHDQILEAKKAVGLFKVIPVSPFIASSEDNMVAVHYDVPTQKGTLAVMKFLVCNKQGFITEIREVFNKKD